MLCKLAWGNVRRAGRDYLVYLLTLTLGVTVFYAFNTISMQVDIAGIDEEGLAQVMGSILGDLTYFLAGVMAFLMVYANNFIMKRRKKEFGLYQVLGMGRGRVATIMALETVIVLVGAFVAGIVLGVGLSQLMTFFTASLFKTQIANFHFFFSVHAFSLTLACMLVMFVLTLLLNLRAVRRTKLIELMGAERRNESIKTRNPWIAIAIFAVGVALVGVAYYRLLRDGFPLTATDSKLQEAMTQFGITTAMVTVGTFALFWGLSGMLIKLLQSLRGVYWRGLNMFTVRQLAAKVNTVCFSMGVIAMLLFLAITSVTCGMSIANVMNENLERYNPVDVSQTYVYYTPDTLDFYKESFNPSEADRMVLADSTVDLYSAWHGDPWHGDRKGKSADNNDETGKKVNIADVAGEHVQIDSYLSYPVGGSNPSVTPSEMCKTMGENKVICIAFLITLFANMAAWSFGVNSVARYAAEHGNMPKVFASMISDDDMPNGANLVNAVVASLVLCLQLVPIDAISNGVFWMLFGTSVLFLLLTYIPMFPAFLNLRKNDPNRERIFTFPFKGAMMKVMLAIPCIELVLAIVATLVPFSAAEIGDKVPMIVIFIVLVLIGEVVRVVSARGRKEEYKGLTPELAAQRLAEEAAEAEEN